MRFAERASSLRREAAIDGLQVTIPGDPTEPTYGPPPDGDGSPTAYRYVWDESAQAMVL